MSDSEYPSWPAEYAPRVTRPASPWEVFSAILVVLACLAGLALLAFMIVSFIMISSYGSNK